MPETLAETQVRLHLERECAAAFESVLAHVHAGFPQCHVTLLAFDYSDVPNAPFNNVAFKTTLPIPRLVRTAEAILRAWGRREPRMVSLEFLRRVGSPTDRDDLEAAGAVARAHLRASVGYSLILGIGEVYQYISAADREGVAEMLRTELLPHWRNGADSA